MPPNARGWTIYEEVIGDKIIRAIHGDTVQLSRWAAEGGGFDAWKSAVTQLVLDLPIEARRRAYSFVREDQPTHAAAVLVVEGHYTEEQILAIAVLCNPRR